MQRANTKKKRIWVIVVLLLICVAATTFTLMNRLGLFMPDATGAIDLTKTGTSQVLGGAQAGAGVKHEYRFDAYDENGTWGAQTTIEIFSISYNENGDMTVVSSDGDNVIAPGTDGSYVFKFKNTGTAAIDYDLTIDAYCTPEGTNIPVETKINRYDGKWVAGSADAYADVKRLDNAADSATLGAGRYTYYTLDWQWAFEGNDELDTMLGNMAAGQDVTFTIELTAVATESADPESTDGILVVQTGDTGNTLLWILLGISALMMIIMLFWKRDDEDEAKA